MSTHNICLHGEISKILTVEPRWLEHRWLVYHGKFELVFESLRNSSDSSRKQIFKEIFLFYPEIVCLCTH